MHCSRRNPRARRGVSLIEVTVAATVMVGMFTVILGFSRMCGQSYLARTADAETQRGGSKAAQVVARDIREARGVLEAGTTRVVLQLPKYGVNRELCVPLLDGNTVAFYAGTEDGTASSNGSVLWRKEPADTGTPVRLAAVTPGGVTFDYYPEAAHPESVAINLSSVRSTAPSGSPSGDAGGGKCGFDANHNYVSRFVTRQEALIRNR